MTLTTYTGRIIDVQHPDPAQIDPVDIAHALSLICRFGGHIHRHYSVAQHSIHVAQVAKKLAVGSNFTGPEAYCEGLIHDCAEAFVGDVISPVKAGCFDFQNVEFRFEDAIRLRFGLGRLRDQSPGLRAIVKRADVVLLAMEEKAFGRGEKYAPVLVGVPSNFRIEPWAASMAEERFLAEISAIVPRTYKPLHAEAV